MKINKESLQKSFIVNDNGLLAETFLDYCDKFQIKYMAGEGRIFYTKKPIIMINRHGLVSWCSSIDFAVGNGYKELKLYDLVRTKESTAVDTLEKMGYSWNGGELWKPPIGKVPYYIRNNKNTKTTYEKVCFEKPSEFVFEILHPKTTDPLILYYLGSNNKYIQFIPSNITGALGEWERGNVYKKVEKPVAWWEDLSEKSPILCVVRMREMHSDQKSIAKIVRSAMTGRFLDINGYWWDDARPLNQDEKRSLLGMLV